VLAVVVLAVVVEVVAVVIAEIEILRNRSLKRLPNMRVQL
jgi:hypothetical protein